MSLISWIDFDVIGDARGSLVVLESDRNIPFHITRVYYLYGLSADIPRGFHAHRKLRQVAVCINGKCEMLMDDGKSRQKVVLDSSSKGLLIDTMQWHEMHNFTEDCILMVLASDHYNESDYIRNYEEFLNEIKCDDSLFE